MEPGFKTQLSFYQTCAVRCWRLYFSIATGGCIEQEKEKSRAPLTWPKRKEARVGGVKPGQRLRGLRCARENPERGLCEIAHKKKKK